MPELLENHWGFDANQIGFPSISACRAIILQTSAGLYGYHMSSNHDYADERAQEFANWVKAHPNWRGPVGSNLVVVTYTQKPNTGYGVDATTDWKREAFTFGRALGRPERRMGYSLSPTVYTGSAYVRATQSTSFPTIEVDRWVDGAPHVLKGTQGPGPNHGWRGQQIPRQIVTAVNSPPGTLTRVNLQSLDD